jgi:hypothetical protein
MFNRHPEHDKEFEQVWFTLELINGDASLDLAERLIMLDVEFGYQYCNGSVEASAGWIQYKLLDR